MTPREIREGANARELAKSTRHELKVALHVNQQLLARAEYIAQIDVVDTLERGMIVKIEKINEEIEKLIDEHNRAPEYAERLRAKIGQLQEELSELDTPREPTRAQRMAQLQQMAMTGNHTAFVQWKEMMKGMAR